MHAVITLHVDKALLYLVNKGCMYKSVMVLENIVKGASLCLLLSSRPELQVI